MLNLLVWLGIVLFCQAAILRIWLEGELFSEVQEFIGKFQNSRFFIIRKVAYLLSCWQCLGVWVAWGVLVIFSLIQDSPVTLRQWPILLLLGFVISLLSELLHHYVLIHLDVIPVNIDEFIPNIEVEEKNGTHYDDWSNSLTGTIDNGTMYGSGEIGARSQETSGGANSEC